MKKICNDFNEYLTQNTGEIEVIKFDKNKFQQERNFVIREFMSLLINKVLFCGKNYDLITVHKEHKIDVNPFMWFDDEVGVEPYSGESKILLSSIFLVEERDVPYENFMKKWRAYWSKFSDKNKLKENKLNDIKYIIQKYKVYPCMFFKNAVFFVSIDIDGTLSAILVKINEDGSITVKKKTSPTTDLEFKLNKKKDCNIV